MSRQTDTSAIEFQLVDTTSLNLKSKMELAAFVVICISISGVCGDVKIPPNLVQQPGKEYIFDSSSGSAEVQLPCVAESPATVQVKYTWTFNEKELSFGPGTRWMTVGEGTIKNSQASSSDEGYYTCYASIKYSSVAKSMVAKSTVALLRQAYLGQLDKAETTLTVAAGNNLQIPCRAAGHYPDPIYLWETVMSPSDDTAEAVNLNSRIQIDMDGGLNFANVVSSDSVNGYYYKCIKFNSYLDIKRGGSYTAVTVTGSPSNHLPQEMFGFEATTVGLLRQKKTLRCYFAGNPVPEITWSRTDGKQFDGHRVTYADDDSSLIIKDIVQDDEIGYKCEGKNSEGADSRIIQMSVEAAPEFQINSEHPTEPTNVNKTEDEDVTFYCETTAIPPAAVQWYINAAPLDSSNPGPRRDVSPDGRQLTVTKVCKNCDSSGSTDLMVIQCNASNIHGYAYGQGYLNVLEATAITKTPTDVHTKNPYEPVSFECQASSDDSTPLSLKWKFNGIEIDPSKPYYDILNANQQLVIYLDQIESPQSLAGKYKCEASTVYSADSAEAALTVDFSGLISTVAPIHQGSVMDYWWAFLLIILFLALIIVAVLLIYCFCCLKGEYNAGKIEDRTPFIDVRKDIYAMDFHPYERPDETTIPAHRNPNISVSRSDSGDEEGSLDGYGEPDVTKFNEDGSFMLMDSANQPYSNNIDTIV